MICADAFADAGEFTNLWTELGHSGVLMSIGRSSVADIAGTSSARAQNNAHKRERRGFADGFPKKEPNPIVAVTKHSRLRNNSIRQIV
jgi:hypothetical protein